MDNTANFEALKAATQGANAISAPAPTFAASNEPELANLYKSTFQLPQSSAAAGGAAGVAGQIAAEQKAAAEKAAAEAKQRVQDAADPTKYRAVKKADGGYDWYAPDGKQVDIATLTKLTNTNPSDWLKDSQNPIDVQYLQDSKNLQDYIQAKLSNDTAKVNAYEKAQSDLKKYQGKGGAAQLIQDFQNHYQRYYVPAQWGVRPSDNPVVPTAQSTSSNSFGIGDPNSIGG